MDDVTAEEILSLQQYVPSDYDYEMSSLTRQTIDQEKEPSKRAKNVVEFARGFIGVNFTDVANGGHQDVNPLLEEPPYIMNNASFVYWCYNNELVGLRGGNLDHTIHTIKNDFNFEVVGNIGSSKSHELLSQGDIVFFNNDRHVGIYSGGGKFISLLGSSESGTYSEIKESDMTRGKWLNYYQGHAIRHREGAGNWIESIV